MKKEKTLEQLGDKLKPNIFKSPMLIASEIFFIIGAIFALVSLVRLVDPYHRAEIIKSIADQEVEYNAAMMWFYLIVAVKALFAVFATAFAVGLVISTVTATRCQGDPCKIRGLGFLGGINAAAVWIWVSLLGIAAIVFVWKFAVYTITLMGQTVDFAIPLAAVVIGEAIMILIIFGVTALLVVMWRGLADLVTQLRYMLYTERVDGHIESVSYISLFGLAALSLYLAGFFAYDLISVIAFLALAVASLLLGICVRILKSRVEWMNYLIYEREKNNT